MNFDLLKTRNSYPQLTVSNDIQWKYLNYAFSYDVILALALTI